MIKALYSESASIMESVAIEYEALVRRTTMRLRNNIDIISLLKPNRRKSYIQDLITNFITETKPIIPEFMKPDRTLDVDRLSSNLYKTINQFGKLTDALEEAKFTDIECYGLGLGNLVGLINGKTFPILDATGKEIYFSSASEVEEIIGKLSEESMDRMSQSRPNLRCSTVQGYRLTAQDGSVCGKFRNENDEITECPTFSIRLKASEPVSYRDMITKYHSFTSTMAKVMIALSEIKPFNIAFSGVPGTGKTNLMYETSYETPNLNKIVIERTPEFPIGRLDDTGRVIQRVKVWYAHSDRNDTGDMALATIRNFYYASLSTRSDVLILGEIRSTEEILVQLEGSVSGTSTWTTIHGTDEESTSERYIKNVMQAKDIDKSSAVEEAYQALNLIIGLRHSYADGKIRVAYISEVCREYGSNGIAYIKPNRLFEFKVTSKKVNPETERIEGKFCKIGVPSTRLKNILDQSLMEDEMIDFLNKPCSPENPIYLDGDDEFVY